MGWSCLSAAASRQSESAVTKSRLVPADRARSGTWPCHAETADLGVPEPRPPVELPILPHIVPVPASVRHGYWWLGLLSPGIPCRDVSYRPDWDSTLSESSGGIARKRTVSDWSDFAPTAGKNW